MDEGTLVMSGLKADRVLESVKVVTSQYQQDKQAFKVVADYQGGAVSKQVLRVVLSYTDYINRTV
jgi:UDP-N-acetylglucosamine 2-epimerase (non-hydrolysing)